MKLKIIFFVFFIFFTFKIFSFQAFIGPSFEFNSGFTEYPMDFYYSLGFSNSYQIKNNFFLEHFVHLGFSYIPAYHAIFGYGEYALSHTTAFYPVFKFGKNRYYFSLSVLGFKFRTTIAGYETYFFENEYCYYENSYATYFPFSSLLLGFSEKLGFDMILGKDNDIILSILYLNVDMYFRPPYYLAPVFHFGVGSSVLFKIKGSSKRNQKFRL